MWKKISSLVNSGKKLKISPEKLFSLAIANSFKGSIVAHANDSTAVIYFNLPDISSDSAIEALAFTISTALFSLNDTIGAGKFSDNGYLFLHKYISGYPDALIASKLLPHRSKILEVKKEASSLQKEITEPLKRCFERQRVPVAELLDTTVKGIYFLLLTGFAVLHDPTASEQKKIDSGATTSEGGVGIPQPKTAEEKLAEYHQHVKKTSSPEQRMKKYITHLKHYRSVFDLFDSDASTSRENIKKKYMEIIKKLHPDQLSELDPALKKEAEDMLALINDIYLLIKDDENYKLLQRFSLLQRRIMNKTDFEREVEVDDMGMKAEALYRLKEYPLAYKMFKGLYDETNYPEYLEKMMWSLYRDETLSRHDKTLSAHQRKENLTKKYREILELIEKMVLMGTTPIDVMFIEAEMAENLGKLRVCRQILKDILLRDPHDFRAKGWLKKIIFYEAREQKAKKK
ncbi:hypothetical protein KAH37_03570 [bacterium]|nr:hypothetical protein [bacterium]